MPTVKDIKLNYRRLAKQKLAREVIIHDSKVYQGVDLFTIPNITKEDLQEFRDYCIYAITHKFEGLDGISDFLDHYTFEFIYPGALSKRSDFGRMESLKFFINKIDK